MHALRAFGSDDALKGLENAGEAVRSYLRAECAGAAREGVAIALALPQIKTEESSNKWLEPLRAVVTRACTEVNNRCGTCSVFGNGNTPLFRPLESKGEVYMKERGLARDRVAMVALLKHTLLTQESVEKTDAERKQVASRAGEMVKNYMQDERRLVQRGEEEAAAGRSAEDAKLLQRQQELLQSRLEGADVESLARGAAHVRMRCEGQTRWEVQLLAAHWAAMREGKESPLRGLQQSYDVQSLCDARAGTEQFVSLVFPPADHALMVAAGGRSGSLAVQGDESKRRVPAFVTVHAADGAPQALVDGENFVMVHDAADFWYEFHAKELDYLVLRSRVE
tara:strand:+ start:722 stop:1735 length:1014 start_codon:yes stop_codon:yes gene_type:complete